MNPYAWHKWFAWYPVLAYDTRRPIGARKKWLCWVETRVVGHVAPNGDMTEAWEYRTC